MSQGINKVAAERNQRILLELVQKPGNDVCADCKARAPRWASHSLGIFICVNCASIHRKMGTHISKVKSVTLDTWGKEQVEIMKQNGNIKSNAFYNPNEARNPPPANMVDQERDSELEKYIRRKYEFKRFIDKSANAAEQLGSSKSSSSFPTPPPKAAPVRSASATLPAAVTKPPRSDSLGYRPPPTATPPQASRSVSHPLPLSPQPPPLAPSVPAKPSNNPVWDDLVSLQSPSISSSLPLQFQPNDPFPNPINALPSQQMPNPTAMGHMQTGIPGVATGMSGMNPFQQQQPQLPQPTGAPNPFNQMSFLSQGTASVPPTGPFVGMQQPSSFGSSIPPFSQSATGQQFQASIQQNQWSAGPSTVSPQPQQLQPPGQMAPPFVQRGSPFGQQPSPFGQQPPPAGQQPSPFGQQPSPFGQQPQQPQQIFQAGNPFGQYQQQQTNAFHGQQAEFRGQSWNGM